MSFKKLEMDTSIKELKLSSMAVWRSLVEEKELRLE
jgi:hypothetical protein